MKMIILFLILPHWTFAYTKGKLLGAQAMVNISSQDSVGRSDLDAHDLYQVMNVTPQNSFIGPGKKIISAATDFNLICNERSQTQYECTVILKQSAQTKLSPTKFLYRVTGAEARNLIALFHLKNNEVHFRTEDQTFRIYGKDDVFAVVYSQDGET